MDNNYSKEAFIDQSKLLIAFFLKKQQWSGVSRSDYERWISNFSDIENGYYIAHRILNLLLYYSEADLIKLLNDAIMTVFEQDVALPFQMAKSFSAIHSELEFAVIDAMRKTIVVPTVTVARDPGASGPEIIRVMRTHFNPQLQSCFSIDILPDSTYERIIIIDDCLGSGEQMSEFWEEAEIGCGEKLRAWVNRRNIPAYYVALVGYKDAVKRIENKYSDIRIICSELLDEQHRLFSSSCKGWENSEEQQRVRIILNDHLSELGMQLEGYNNLDFAVALHRTIPDWSLPMFYKETRGWKHLLERKDTYA